MNPIAFIAYQLIGLEVILFVIAFLRFRTIPKEDTEKRQKARLKMYGMIALLLITLLGSGIAIYFSVTPMYREVPRIEGHYASDVPPDEIIPLGEDYCLAIYPLRNESSYEMGLFQTREEDRKTLYRYEEYLSLHLPWSQSDYYGWWLYDFEEFRYYHEWVEIGNGFYGAVCPKDGEIVPDESHTATITREITVNDEVYIVYIAVERAF
jgi:hypothetical protein